MRNKFSKFTTFYPADNRLETRVEKYNVSIAITMDEPIAGIDKELGVLIFSHASLWSENKQTAKGYC